MKNDDNKPWKALDDKAPKLPSSSRQEQWVPTDHVHEDDGGKHGGDGDNHGDGDVQLFWMVLIRTTLMNLMTMLWWWKYCQNDRTKTFHWSLHLRKPGQTLPILIFTLKHQKWTSDHFAEYIPRWSRLKGQCLHNAQLPEVHCGQWRGSHRFKLSRQVIHQGITPSVFDHCSSLCKNLVTLSIMM